MQNEPPPSQQYSVLVDESSSPSVAFSLARSSRRVKVLAALLGVAIVCAVGVGGYCGSGKCSASTNNNAHQTNEAAIPSAPSAASAPSVPTPIQPPSPAPVPPPPASPASSPSAPPSSAPKDPSASSWTEVLTLDCNGALHGLASQGLLKMFAFTPLIKGLLNQLHDAVINDAKYHCPSISAQEIADHFDVNVGSLLGLLQAGYVRVPLSCNNNPKTSFEVSLESLQNQVNFSLPATCSPASWQSGQTCFMQYAFDSTATLRLGASACPNSNVPFVSLQCSGVMCNQLVRPCQYDSDCDSGVKCTQIVDPSSVRDAFLQFLQRDTAWYINSDPSNQCELPGGGYLTDKVVGSFALEELMSFWGSFTQLADPTHVSGLQVCGWGNIQNYTNWFSNCSTSADGVTSCPSLSAWNGISDSGEPINSPNRMSGQAFSPPQPVPTPQNPKVVTLVNWTESVFYALPNTRFAYTARTPDYSSILQQASSIMQAVLSCKNGSVFNMGINEFQSRLVPWTGLMHLFGLTVHDAPSPPFSPLPEGNIDYENTAFVHGDQGAGLIWNAFQSVWPVAAEFVNDLINNAYISPYPLNYYISEYLTSALNPIDFLLEVIRSIISGAGVSGGMFGLNFESIFLEAATNVKLFMVDGCTYADVVATGECRLQYEGVRTALGLDATLRAVVTRSARNPNGLPNIVIDCVGSDCVTLATLGDSTFGAEPCYQNGDCASGSCGLLGSDTELVFPDFIPTVLWGGSGQSNIQQFSINFNGNLQQQDIAKVTNAIQNSFNGFFSYNVSGVIGNVDLVSTLVATNTLSFTAYPTSSVAASNVGEAYGTFWACYYGQPTIQYLIDIIQNSGASVTFNSCQPLGTLPMYYSPNLSPPWGLTMDLTYVSQNTWEWFNLIRSTMGYAPLQPDLTRVPGVCKPPIFTFIQNAASGFDFNAFYTGTFPIYNNVMKMTDLEPYKGDE